MSAESRCILMPVKVNRSIDEVHLQRLEVHANALEVHVNAVRGAP
jgi:hypothetical protein